jgi:hypothetical protein
VCTTITLSLALTWNLDGISSHVIDKLDPSFVATSWYSMYKIFFPARDSVTVGYCSQRYSHLVKSTHFRV